jgi:hypothetical protein
VNSTAAWLCEGTAAALAPTTATSPVSGAKRPPRWPRPPSPTRGSPASRTHWVKNCSRPRWPARRHGAVSTSAAARRVVFVLRPEPPLQQPVLARGRGAEGLAVPALLSDQTPAGRPSRGGAD